jgi:hypothetical protein
MINFEFIESPDLDIIAPFKYFQNQIYIGRTVGDLWVNDKDLFPSHIFLEVIGSDLLIHPQKDVEHYLLNGKRASSIRKLKVNDAITIGKTTFKILSFSETMSETKQEILDRKLDKLILEESLRIPIIESLTKLMEP